MATRCSRWLPSPRSWRWTARSPTRPSPMALEDLASMRAIHGSTVLYPSDPNQTAKLTRIMADTPGIVFMRTTRGAYPTLYGANETFKVGGSKVLRQSPKDKVALIGA